MSTEDEITFDKENFLRLLGEENTRNSQTLIAESAAFSSKTTQFVENVANFHSYLAHLAEEVEKAKMTAIGQRNKIESQKEVKHLREREYIARLDEKTSQLERLHTEYESLVRIEQEQNSLLQKMKFGEM